MSYEDDGGAARSRLVQVQACAGSACLRPSRFTWSSGAAGWQSGSSLALDPASLANAFAGDFDGDGFEDLAYHDAATRKWMVLPGSGTGPATSPIDTGAGADSLPGQAVSGDLDGNGRPAR